MTFLIGDVIAIFCAGCALSGLVCGAVYHHKYEMRKLELQRDDLERRVIMLADQRWPRSKP